MRRITLWALGTVTTVVLLFGYHTSTEGATSVATSQEPVGGSLSTAEDSSTDSSTPSSSSAPSSSASPSAGSSSGSTTVTGSVAQTEWGPVQVQISTSSGTITDIEVLQYPNGNGRDQEINSYALPQLIQETLDAQSANIDMVSGATVTSGGYLQSLQSALDQVSGA